MRFNLDIVRLHVALTLRTIIKKIAQFCLLSVQTVHGKTEGKYALTLLITARTENNETSTQNPVPTQYVIQYISYMYIPEIYVELVRQLSLKEGYVELQT